MKIMHLRGVVLLAFVFLLLLPIESSALSFSNSKHYYVAGKDSCVFPDFPSAFEIGEKLAHGEPISHNFESLLYGAEFNPKEDVIEPLHLAYGFYIVAGRIGDGRSFQRKNWVLPYIHPSLSDKVVSAIYRKYSAKYLKTCFSIGQAVVNNTQKVEPKSNSSNLDTDPNYDLYMYMGQ